MNQFKRLSLISVLFLFMYSPADNTRFVLSNDYAVTIHGTSNLHSWKEKVETVSGEAIIHLNDDGSFDLNTMTVRMDVRSIKSEKGTVMNNNTYKALKGNENPQIIFTLSFPVQSIPVKSDHQFISAKGNLSIAGITKAVDIKVSVLLQEHQKLFFEGSQTLRMTDYNIKPPVAILGTLKTGNEITINFKANFVIKN